MWRTEHRSKPTNTFLTTATTSFLFTRCRLALDINSDIIKGFVDFLSVSCVWVFYSCLICLLVVHMPLETLVCHSSAAMHALKLQFDFQMSALCHLFNIPTHTCLSWSLLWRWRCATEVKDGFYSNCAYWCHDPPDQHASILGRFVLRILKFAAFWKVPSFIFYFLGGLFIIYLPFKPLLVCPPLCFSEVTE